MSLLLSLDEEIFITDLLLFLFTFIFVSINKANLGNNKLVVKTLSWLKNSVKNEFKMFQNILLTIYFCLFKFHTSTQKLAVWHTWCEIVFGALIPQLHFCCICSIILQYCRTVYVHYLLQYGTLLALYTVQ